MIDESMINTLETVGSILAGSYREDRWDTVHFIQEKIRQKDYKAAYSCLPSLYASPPCYVIGQPSTGDMLEGVSRELKSRIEEQEKNRQV